MKTRFWGAAAFVALLALGLALTAGLMASSHSSARNQMVLTKAGGENGKDLAGIPNEGPNGTWEAQQEAQRAYPADSVPDEAASNSINTYSSNFKGSSN